jgi:hypothetical protein
VAGALDALAVTRELAAARGFVGFPLPLTAEAIAPITSRTPTARRIAFRFPGRRRRGRRGGGACLAV